MALKQPQRHPLNAVSMLGVPSSKAHCIAWISKSSEGVDDFGYVIDGIKTINDVNKATIAFIHAIDTLNLLPMMTVVSAKTMQDGTIIYDLDWIGGTVRLQSRYVIATSSYDA